MNQQDSEHIRREYDDEIDLVDLFLILWRRKWLIVAVTLLCFLAALIYLLTRVDRYSYVTTFEIGTTLEGKDDRLAERLIESPEIVKVKFDQVYIPQAMKKQREGHDETRSKAESSIQKDSNIILISSTGEYADQELYHELHQQIVTPIIEEHQEIISSSLKKYQIKVESARLELKELEDPKIYMFDDKVLQGEISEAKTELLQLDDEKQLIESQRERLLETQKILREQIAKIEKNLELAYAKRPQATAEVDDEAKALTFLMINNQIEQNENRLAALQERLQIDIEDQKQVLANQLTENRRNWNLQKAKITELESKLIKQRAERESSREKQKNVIADAVSKIDLYRSSQTLGLAERSLEPEGPRKLLVLALSGMLGLMGGIMLAFIAEFMNKVRQQQKILEEV